MASNIKSGTDFEKIFCKLAYDRGFWAHRLNANKNGQPADILLTKNNISALIDCKVCEKNVFPFSRIEENQFYAMKAWLKAGNTLAYFALLVCDGIRIIPFNLIREMIFTGSKQFNLTEIIQYGYTFPEWEERFYGNNSQ